MVSGDDGGRGWDGDAVPEGESIVARDVGEHNLANKTHLAGSRRQSVMNVNLAHSTERHESTKTIFIDRKQIV